MEKRLTYNIQVERDEDGIYVVSVPALPGCFTQGRTFDEAMTATQDAIHSFIKTLVRRGKRVPVENARVSPFVVSVMFPQSKVFEKALA